MYVHENDWAEEPSRPLEDPRVFNAPIPLYGEVTWEGEFRNGVFYAAIWPDTHRGEDLVEENARLDAVELAFVNDDDLRRLIEARLAEEGHSLDDYTRAGLGINDAARDVGLPSLRAARPLNTAAEQTPPEPRHTVRVLRIDVDGTREVVEAQPTLESLQSLIGGGLLEPVSPDLERQSVEWTASCDEEGTLKWLPPNVAATLLAERFGWTPWRGDVLVGPVIFLGGLDDGGHETDVPEQLIAGPPTTLRAEVAPLERLKRDATERQAPSPGIE